jgi:hypothetical protein
MLGGSRPLRSSGLLCRSLLRRRFLSSSSLLRRRLLRRRLLSSSRPLRRRFLSSSSLLCRSLLFRRLLSSSRPLRSRPLRRRRLFRSSLLSSRLLCSGSPLRTSTGIFAWCSSYCWSCRSRGFSDHRGWRRSRSLGRSSRHTDRGRQRIRMVPGWVLARGQSTSAASRGAPRHDRDRGRRVRCCLCSRPRCHLCGCSHLSCWVCGGCRRCNRSKRSELPGWRGRSLRYRCSSGGMRCGGRPGHCCCSALGSGCLGLRSCWRRGSCGCWS